MINKAFTTSITEARKFDSKQHLFERDITEYSKVNEQSMADYYKWIKNIELWMYGVWSEMHADHCKQFV